MPNWTDASIQECEDIKNSGGKILSYKEGFQQDGETSTMRHSERGAVEYSQRSSGFGILWLLIFALVGFMLYAMFIYLPGQLDQRYTGSGQVIGMVNPSGENPTVDQQYANINKDNAQANLTNSQAEQRRSTIPLGWVFMFLLFGTIIFIFGMIGKSVSPPKI